MRKLYFALKFVAIMLFTQYASAGVVMYGTRVIINEEDSSAVVRFANNDAHSNLMQIWVDKGEGNPSRTDKNAIPFTLTPPLFKINGGGQQTVKIIKKENVRNLPKDRESLFWLNFLQIPPVSENSSSETLAKVNLSFLNQVKLIYRPTSLIDGINDAWKNIAFSVNASNRIKVTNSSGYYFTFRENVEVINKGRTYTVNYKNIVTLPPFSSLTWELVDSGKSGNGSKIDFQLIDDKGNGIKHVAELAR